MERPKGRLLPHIFKAQGEHVTKYTTIEGANGFPVPLAPWRIDDKFVQKRVKDLCWCATEEIAEALEERPNVDGHTVKDWRLEWDANASIRHMMEEIADATHFFVEATIMANVTANDVMAHNRYWDEQRDTVPVAGNPLADLESKCFEFILAMGLVCNCLKNKTWKTSHMQTDQAKFNRLILDSWDKFAGVWCAFGATVPEVFDLYHKKSTVNKFRQETKY